MNTVVEHAYTVDLILHAECAVPNMLFDVLHIMSTEKIKWEESSIYFSHHPLEVNYTQ